MWTDLVSSEMKNAVGPVPKYNKKKLILTYNIFKIYILFIAIKVEAIGTSADGILAPEGITRPVVSVFCW